MYINVFQNKVSKYELPYRARIIIGVYILYKVKYETDMKYVIYF